MPTPRSGEGHDDYIARCIPYVINEGTAASPKQAYAICQSLWGKTKSGPRAGSRVFAGLAGGLAGPVRLGTYQGRPHLVVPVVALVGDAVVRPIGSAAPEFVPAEELAVAPDGWNGRPILPDHPHGGQASANDPETLDRWQFGQLFNTTFKDGLLKTEAWLDLARAEEVGPEAQRVVADCRAEKMVEVSVGVFVVAEKTRGVSPGGVPYAYIWREITPDHLAMGLNGKEGACSIEMGCGAPRLMTADPRVLGGPGSGNFGHEGRPGEVGGSAPGDAGGGTAGGADSIPGRAELETKIREGQGFTYNAVTGDQPKHGYVVSVYRDREVIHDPAQVTVESVHDFAVHNWDLLTHSGNHVGGWLDKGRFFYDVSRVVDSLAEALKLGAEHDQEAVWDLEHFVSVPVPGAKQHERKAAGRSTDATDATDPLPDGDGQGPPDGGGHDRARAGSQRAGTDSRGDRAGEGTARDVPRGTRGGALSGASSGRHAQGGTSMKQGAILRTGVGNATAAGEDGPPAAVSASVGSRFSRVLEALGIRTARPATSPTTPDPAPGTDEDALGTALDRELRAAEAAYEGIAKWDQAAQTVVYFAGDGIFMRAYTTAAPGDPSPAPVLGPAVPVEPVMDYRQLATPASPLSPASPSPVPAAGGSGCGCPTGQPAQEGDTMSKVKDLVGRLLATKAAPFTEADKTVLEALGEERLTAIVAHCEAADAGVRSAAPADDGPDEDDVCPKCGSKDETGKFCAACGAKMPAEPKSGKKTASSKKAAHAPVRAAADPDPDPEPKDPDDETEEEQIAKLPETLRAMVSRAKAEDAKLRVSLVASLAKAQSVKTEEQLRGLTTEDLSELAEMLKVGRQRDYSGRAVASGNDMGAEAPKPYTLAIEAAKTAKAATAKAN